MSSSDQNASPVERALFMEALEQASREARTAFLDRACGSDMCLRERVLALLGQFDQMDDFLEAPVVSKPGDSTEGARSSADGDRAGKPVEVSPKSGDRVGRYLLREQIGEGGCGVVYVADQEDPVRRRVALKVVKLGMDTREVVARFEAERQALALMDHPNIAKVLDAGATETGRPYFVMELVRGIRITEYCDQHQLSTHERLHLFIQVCHALQHAHQKGIIHRDIKPSNVLVTMHDGVPVPKVIDFGIAKAMAQKLTDKTVYTAFEQFLGTPAYTSPEQAEMSGLDIDTRSDIYALGVLLYELLTGKTPFDAQKLVEAGLETMRRTIREEEPLRPSTRLTQELVAADVSPHKSTKGLAIPTPEEASADPRRRLRLQEQIHILHGDLDWIVMKCLEKDRARRYETANGLAMDIQRHLNHEPVLAGPPTVAYRARKFVRRNRVLVAAGSAVAAALVLGVVVSTWHAVQAVKARNQARRAETAAQWQRDQAQAAQRLTDQTLRQLELHHAEESFSDDKAADGLAVLAAALRENPTDRGIGEWLLNELTQRSFALPVIEPIRHEDIVHGAWFSPEGARVLTVCRNNTARLWDASTGLPLTPPLAHDQSVIRKGEYLEGLHPLHADISADGTRIATASADGTARLWDAHTGRALSDALPHGNLVSCIRFSADAEFVATACKDGKVRLWRVRDSQLAGSHFSHQDWVNSVEFSPDGQWLVSASDDGTAQVWAVPSGKKRGAPMRHARWVKYACFSPDGRRVVTASEDATARLWDAVTGLPLSQPLTHGHIVVTATFSPDGRWVATASFDKTARIWDALTGEPVGKPLRHQGVVRSVNFSQEGLRLITASEDGTARVWDAGAGEPLTEPMRHDGVVWSAQFSPNGQRAVTASADGTARLWDVRPGQAVVLRLPHMAAVRSARWKNDGATVFTSSVSGAGAWDAGKGVDRLMISDSWIGAQVSGAEATPDGRFLAVAFDNHHVRLWEMARGRDQPLAPDLVHLDAIRGMSFSPDSQRLVTASADRTARVWDVATGSPVGVGLKHDDTVLDAQFSPDGQFVLTASADGTARMWSPINGALVLPPLKHAGLVTMARFSPDGAWIATASADHTARLWDARTGQPHRPPLGHKGVVNTVQFSSDSTRLVTASADHTAKVWKVKDGLPLLDPLRHEERVEMAEFTPDGRWVLTASRDGTARFWNATTGQPSAEPLRHSRSVRAVHGSPDGRWVVTASEDRTAALWRVMRPAEAPPAWLPELAEAVAGKRLTASGEAADAPVKELLRIKQSMPKSVEPGEYERWAAWFFADRGQRQIAPDASMSVAEFIKDRGHWACHRFSYQPERLEEALFFEPTNALCLAALALGNARLAAAQNPSALARLDWLARAAVRLAPNQPVAQWARALTLAQQGEFDAALRLMEQARRGGCDDTCYWVDYTDLLVKRQRLSDAYATFKEALIWPYSESSLERHLRLAHRDDWARGLARNQPFRALRVFSLMAEDICDRPPEASPQMLDLSLGNENKLVHLWLGTGADLADLADFLESPITLRGVTFDTRGIINAHRPHSDPVLVQTFPVNRVCRRLHFLQTASARLTPGTRVGSYGVVLVDGERLEVPIVYGDNVCAFAASPGEPAPTATVAWERRGSNGTQARLCMLTWDNPLPETPIDRLEFHAESLPCNPVLIAITAEP